MRTRTYLNIFCQWDTWISILFIMTLALISPGCNLDEPAPKKPAIISENTIILDEESLDLLSVDPENPLILTFTDPPPQSVITGLKAGDIIVAGTHRKLPTGFLRRIENVEHGDNLVIARTTNATLSDAIEQCQIHETVPVAFVDTPRTEYKNSRGSTYIEIKGGIFEIKLPVEIDGIELSASFSLEPKAVIDIDIDRHGLNSFMFKLVFEVNASGNSSTSSEKNIEDLLEDLDLIDKLDWLDFDDEIPIPISVSPIFFFINVVPVVITPNLALEYGWEFKLYGSCDMSIKKSYTFEAGFKYENRKVKPVRSFSEEPVKFTVNTSSDVMFRPFVGSKLSFLFYDCGGPYIAFDVFGEIDGNVTTDSTASSITTETSASLNLSVTGGMKCVVGIDVNNKFKTLIGEEAEEVLEGVCLTIFHFSHKFKDIHISLFSSKPDLIPGMIVPDILLPVDGDLVTFTCEIENTRGTAAESFDILWKWDDEDPVRKTIPGIPGYSPVTVSCSRTVFCGVHTLLLEVDPDDSVDEAYEHNNATPPYTLEVNETYPPMADLSVSPLELHNEELKNGNTVTVNAYIANIGSVPSEPCAIRWTWDRTVIKTDQIGSISPLNDIEVSCDYKVYDRYHELTLEVDFENMVPEPSTENNAASTPIYVEGTSTIPDLSFPEIIVKSEDLFSGNEAVFHAVISNNGANPVGSFTIEWTWDDSPTPTPTPARPDVICGGIDVPDAMKPDTTYTLYATVINSGPGYAYNIPVARYVDGGSPGETDVISSLGPASSATVSYSWRAIMQYHTIEVRINPSHSIIELNDNYGNNNCSIRVFVGN